MSAKPNGFVLWRGLSQLDGVTPIVAIVTGTRGKASVNAKTGSMLQTWILRADKVSPLDAVKRGLDAAGNGAGSNRKGSIAIIAHGAMSRRYIAIRNAATL